MEGTIVAAQQTKGTMAKMLTSSSTPRYWRAATLTLVHVILASKSTTVTKKGGAGSKNLSSFSLSSLALNFQSPICFFMF